MIISWHGISCFTIQGDKSIVVTDPFSNEYGLKLPKLTGDIVTISHNHNDHNNHNNFEAVKPTGEKNPFIIDGAGEYEIKETFVYGIPSYHDDSKGSQRGANIIFRIEMEGISIGHLGDLGHMLENEQVEKLEGIDILIIPVGGKYTINSREANQIISQLEPRIVIPMHYKIPGLKSDIDDLGVFCKEIGVCPAKPITKLKIVKKDLPQQDLQVVTLEP